MNYLIPTIVEGEMHDGSIVEAICKCKQKYGDNPCKKFYAGLAEAEEGFYICPSGHTAYVKHSEAGNIIFSAMHVKNHYKKAHSNEKKYLSDIMVVQEELFLNLVNEQQRYLKIQNDAKRTLEIHRDLLHDIRKLDSLVKQKAESIIAEYDKGNQNHELMNMVKNIQAMEELIACKYSVYDLVSNIAVLTIGNKSSVNIYKKFDKIRYILTGYKNKGCLFFFTVKLFMSIKLI